MSRPRGGFIGYTPQPAASAINSAAGGIWTLREAEELKRAGTWPFPIPPFLPDDLSGLQLWLDAADANTLYDATTGGSLVAADGGVARWEDKSGEANHVTQSTSGDRPLLKAAQINNLNAAEFNGTSHWLSTSQTITDSQSRTVFAVAKRADNNSVGTVARFGPVSGAIANTNLWLCRYGTSANPHVGGEARFTNQDLSAGLPAGWTNAHVSCWSQNSSTRNLTYLLNGSSLSITGNPPQEQTDFEQMSIGVFNAASATPQYFAGLIGELIVYNQELSSTDRQSVTDYLIAKWGIT